VILLVVLQYFQVKNGDADKSNRPEILKINVRASGGNYIASLIYIFIQISITR